jgi:mono/diheme cytochrome c family protein
MHYTQHHRLSTRLPELSRGTQFRTIVCTLGAALLTLSALVSNPVDAQKTGTKQPPTRREQPVTKGHDLFVRNCSPCHGANAQGGEGPNLHGLKLTDQMIISTIKNGIKSEMPAFATRFKDAELKDIVAYLRSLKK